MASNAGRAPRRYTHEEKVALVTEIDRRHRAGEGPLRLIANQLGTTDTSYLNWRRAGIEPQANPQRPPVRRVFSQAERDALLTEVERLRELGDTVEDACRSLGFSDKTYRAWRAKARFPMRPVELITSLVPVLPRAMTVAPVPESHPLTLVAPGGYRIEGLTTESAVALLRALA
ncbi:MAG: transposase [bacterium]|nr:transposase [bacterium]